MFFDDARTDADLVEIKRAAEATGEVAMTATRPSARRLDAVSQIARRRLQSVGWRGAPPRMTDPGRLTRAWTGLHARSYAGRWKGQPLSGPGRDNVCGSGPSASPGWQASPSHGRDGKADEPRGPGISTVAAISIHPRREDQRDQRNASRAGAPGDGMRLSVAPRDCRTWFWMAGDRRDGGCWASVSATARRAMAEGADVVISDLNDGWGDGRRVVTLGG